MDLKPIGLALVAIVIAIGAYFHGSVQTVVKTFGAAVSCGGNTTCLIGDLNLTGAFSFGSGDPSVSYQQQESVGTCNAGAFVASSTQFVVSNPFAATSTATIDTLIGAGQATSTTFSVGTTTLSTGLALANVSPSLVNNALVSTTSVSFYVNPGQTSALGTGQVTAGTSVNKIVVGPTENIAMFATSTYTGVGALNYTPGITCTYKIRWSK